MEILHPKSAVTSKNLKNIVNTVDSCYLKHSLNEPAAYCCRTPFRPYHLGIGCPDHLLHSYPFQRNRIKILLELLD